MSEFDFLNWVLSDKYLSPDQGSLKDFDSKSKCIQHVRIDEFFIRNRSWYLYRYDMKDTGDHLPFFRDGQGSPSGLRSFCDYILLTEENGHTYVFLIELKSGETAGHTKQIEAGRFFINFVVDSARRICADNDFPEFDEGKIIIRRVLITPRKSKKTTTIVRPRQAYTALNDIISYSETSFCPLALM